MQMKNETKCKKKVIIKEIIQKMQQVRRLGKLQAHSSVLMVCDVQERFRSVITHMPSVLHVARTMVKKSILLAFGARAKSILTWVACVRAGQGGAPSSRARACDRAEPQAPRPHR
jgi:hypothetical protein